MYFKTISLFVLLAAYFIAADVLSSDCSISIAQNLRTSWENGDGSRYKLYDCVITNNGENVVNDVKLTTHSEFANLWGLVPSGDAYYLPDYVPSLAIEQETPFGYIVRGDDQAEFEIEFIDCGLSSGGSDPTRRPNWRPTSRPTSAPTTAPTSKPTTAPTSKPTTAPTTAPTSKPTTTPTSKPTTAPTSKPTSAPTTAPTSKPTTAPTTAPTSKPTTAPTSKPTSAPTAAPTSKPTTAPTSKPTTAPTTAPTSKPSSAPTTTGKICPAGTWWRPAPMTTWQWQLTGSIDTSPNVQMFDIDLFDNDAATITRLHSAGKVVICYFSTQYEDWRPDASSFSSAVLGNNLDDWAGERYVDIRSSVVRNIMAARLDLAASKGCDGVEPDNVDGYQASTGFPLKAADQLSYNQYLAQAAHERGLSIALKNDLDQVSALQPYFDWALNEQCNEYSECDMLKPFTDAGKAVFNTEYAGTASSFCPRMNTAKISSLLKDLSLGAAIRAQCCTYAAGGCTPASYQCVSSASSIVEDEFTQNATVATEEGHDVKNTGFLLRASFFLLGVFLVLIVC